MDEPTVRRPLIMAEPQSEVKKETPAPAPAPIIVTPTPESAPEKLPKMWRRIYKPTIDDVIRLKGKTVLFYYKKKDGTGGDERTHQFAGYVIGYYLRPIIGPDGKKTFPFRESPDGSPWVTMSDTEKRFMLRGIAWLEEAA